MPLPKLSKKDLNRLTTICGFIAGICTAFATQGVKVQFFGIVGGIALAFHGLFTQMPASEHPTTAEVEEEKIQN